MSMSSIKAAKPNSKTSTRLTKIKFFNRQNVSAYKAQIQFIEPWFQRRKIMQDICGNENESRPTLINRTCVCSCRISTLLEEFYLIKPDQKLMSSFIDFLLIYSFSFNILPWTSLQHNSFTQMAYFFKTKLQYLFPSTCEKLHFSPPIP